MWYKFGTKHFYQSYLLYFMQLYFISPVISSSPDKNQIY